MKIKSVRSDEIHKKILTAPTDKKDDIIKKYIKNQTDADIIEDKIKQQQYVPLKGLQLPCAYRV
ncbi:hypothetical protein [Marinisporobacter balticus]|uniref:Uncharacterized protein n=1 Tax=Marinisporobacter balticus TaxID=2018667 RepID=A0A4R2K9W7_9FIRM|nr:hypothetical protein [Marinisporobacter balticus]TCO68932.1 hypothetical protein EV214_13724 [Marinisporobacter balticus]